MSELVQNIPYDIQGYHKYLTFDNKGDLTGVDYYQGYDPETEDFSNLKVKETRTYTRAASTLLEKRDMLIEWYGGTQVVATKETVKYYTPELGYKANKRARQNLIDTASMYLLSTVGQTDAENFLDGVATAISTYVDGHIQPLLTLISDSAEAYMTATVKANLDGILNVAYGS